MAVARLAYGAQEPHWPNQGAQPWSFLYHFGVAPANITALLGLLGFVASFSDSSKRQRRAWRGPGLYLFLFLILGPGLLVNVLGKGLAGRPRPSDLVEFGGAWDFLRPFQLGIPGKGKSFLSGHASTAFYFFTLFFVFKGRKRWAAFFGAVAFGSLMGIARIFQGGHFLSDVVLCGALLFTLAACLSPLIHWQPRVQALKRPAFLAACFGLGMGILLIANPIYEERHPAFAQPLKAKAVNIKLELKSGDINVNFNAENSRPLNLSEVYRAQALPGSKVRLEVAALTDSPTWKIGPEDIAYCVTQRVRGFTWNTQATYALQLPATLACEARLKTPHGAIIINALPKNRAVLIYGDPDMNPASLPEGFQPYGAKGYFRQGEKPLIMLTLNAASLHFE